MGSKERKKAEKNVSHGTCIQTCCSDASWPYMMGCLWLSSAYLGSGLKLALGTVLCCEKRSNSNQTGTVWDKIGNPWTLEDKTQNPFFLNL